MADEATIRIRMDGGRHPGPGGASGSAPGAAPPPAGTPRIPPAPQPIDVRPRAQKTVDTLDIVARMTDEFRGKMGSVFGGLLSAVLDMSLAWRDMQKQFSERMPSENAPAGTTAPTVPAPATGTTPPRVPLPPPASSNIPTARAAPQPVPPPAPMQAQAARNPVTLETTSARNPYTLELPQVPTARPAAPRPITGNLVAQAAPAALEPVALSAAAGPLAIVGAVIAGMVALKSVTLGAVDAMGSFATTISSPDSNPAQYFEAFGRQTTEATEKLIYIGNALGILGPAIGHASESFGRLMRNLDATAQRYEQYDARLATATALADVRQTLGDLRRSREIGPELGRYVDAQSQMQQKYEDLKVELLRQILPATTDAVKVATVILEAIKPLTPLVRIAVESSLLVRIVRLLARLVGQNEEQLELPDPIGVTLEQRGIRVP